MELSTFINIIHITHDLKCTEEYTFHQWSPTHHGTYEERPTTCSTLKVSEASNACLSADVMVDIGPLPVDALLDFHSQIAAKGIALSHHTIKSSLIHSAPAPVQPMDAFEWLPAPVCRAYGCQTPFARNWFAVPKVCIFWAKGCYYIGVSFAKVCLNCAYKICWLLSFLVHFCHQYQLVKVSDGMLNSGLELWLWGQQFWSRYWRPKVTTEPNITANHQR